MTMLDAPPQNPLDPTHAAADAELAVAGAALLRVDCAEAAGALLAADGSEFGNMPAGAVFAAALKIAGGGQAVTPAAVLRQMHRDGTAQMVAGDVNRLYALIEHAAVGVENTRYNAEIVSADAGRRRILRACIYGQQITSNPGFDPATDADRVLSALQSATVARDEDRALYARDHMDKLITTLKTPDRSPVLPSPWPDLDRVVKLRAGRFVLVAARPGGGKSLAGIKIASHGAVELDRPAVVFSMEMPGEDVMVRVAADLAKIPLSNIDDGNLSPFDWEKINEMRALIADKPFIVDDTERLTMAHIRARLRWMASEGIPAQYVVVDYVQLMELDKSWGDAGWERLGALSRELKILAGEFNCVVIGMAQLNRLSENKTDKRPAVSELRGSGNLEQDADTVILLWQEPHPDDPSMPLKPGEVKFLVDKNRRGPRAEVDLLWQPHYGRIGNFGKA